MIQGDDENNSISEWNIAKNCMSNNKLKVHSTLLLANILKYFL